VLPRSPVEVGGNGDACEAVLFDEDVRTLRCAVLKARAEPRVDITRNVDSCCSDKVVPFNS
jgi:hypothetical protein